MRLVALCLVVLTCLWGHAILKESTPAPRGVVHGPDAVFRLRFNSRVDRSNSRLAVEDTRGSRPATITGQPAPDTLVGEAKELAPGKAVLRWQVFAVDGHLTRGELPFEVQ